MIGRKTKGGLVMMPNQPTLPPVRAPDACGFSEDEGDVGDSEGEGEVGGVGLGGAWRLKLAQGLGGTLAQSLWMAGLSPANGFTTWMKAPFASVTTEVATWLGLSQYSVMLSFFRKPWPVAVMPAEAWPAVGSSPMLAPMGRGAYTVAAGPVTFLELVAVTENVYVMLFARFDAT
jgi:hypothetical protein